MQLQRSLVELCLHYLSFIHISVNLCHEQKQAFKVNMNSKLAPFTFLMTVADLIICMNNLSSKCSLMTFFITSETPFFSDDVTSATYAIRFFVE